MPNTIPDDLKASGIDKMPVPNDAFSKWVKVSLSLEKYHKSLGVVLKWDANLSEEKNKIDSYDVGCWVCRSVNGLNSVVPFSVSFFAGWILYLDINKERKLGENNVSMKLFKLDVHRTINEQNLTHSVPFGM